MKKKPKPEAIFLTGGNTICTCSVCHLRLHCLWCGMQARFAEGQLTRVLWLPVASPAVILFINWEIWSSFKFIQNDLLWCCSCKTILLVLWSLFGNIFQLFGNCWLASYITICLTLTNNWRIPCWEIFFPLTALPLCIFMCFSLQSILLTYKLILLARFCFPVFHKNWKSCKLTSLVYVDSVADY